MARVLVIDDNADFCGLASILIQSYGYESKCECEVEALLKLVRDGWPDLVILDVSLPGIDSFNLLRTIRLLDGAVPVVMYTATELPRQREQALSLGAQDYVMKDLSDLDLFRDLVATWTSPVSRGHIDGTAGVGGRVGGEPGTKG